MDITEHLQNTLCAAVNPIPTSHGRNQPIYERHVTKSGRNRVKDPIRNIKLRFIYIGISQYFFIENIKLIFLWDRGSNAKKFEVGDKMYSIKKQYL